MGKFRNHLSPPVMCHHDPIRLLIISGNFGFKMILRFAFDHVQLHKASTTILGPSFNSINQSRRKMFAREISFSWKTAATVFLSLLEAIILASLLGHNSSRCNQSRALLFAQPTLMRSSWKMHLLITQKKRIKMKSFFVYSFARSDHKKNQRREQSSRESKQLKPEEIVIHGISIWWQDVLGHKFCVSMTPFALAACAELPVQKMTNLMHSSASRAASFFLFLRNFALNPPQVEC